MRSGRSRGIACAQSQPDALSRPDQHGDIGGPGIPIGNGADGTSALDPNNGAGGVLFGDGGNGGDATTLGTAGGDGGAGGEGGIAHDGNGGAGSDGYEGSMGGAGGDAIG